MRMHMHMHMHLDGAALRVVETLEQLDEPRRRSVPELFVQTK